MDSNNSYTTNEDKNKSIINGEIKEGIKKERNIKEDEINFIDHLIHFTDPKDLNK